MIRVTKQEPSPRPSPIGWEREMDWVAHVTQDGAPAFARSFGPAGVPRLLGYFRHPLRGSEA
jgi:hypothetical protein